MVSTPITFLPSQIQPSLIAELQDKGKQQSVTAKLTKMSDSLIVTGVSPDGFAMSLSDGSVKTVPQALFDRLSFTHIVQLLHVEDSCEFFPSLKWNLHIINFHRMFFAEPRKILFNLLTCNRCSNYHHFTYLISTI